MNGNAVAGAVLLGVVQTVKPTSEAFWQEPEASSKARRFVSRKAVPMTKASKQPEQVRMTGRDGRLIMFPPHS